MTAGVLRGARCDHIAIAVPDRAHADRAYVDTMGAGRVALARHGGIEIEQLRFGNGCKLELLSPCGDSSGATRLSEHLRDQPAGVHHLTLLVDVLDEAVATLASSGVRCVGVSDQPDGSREAFVLPRDAAGVLVQLVQKDASDDEWARRHGQVAQDPSAGAARFLGARCGHTDVETAASQLTLLGAAVTVSPTLVEAQWAAAGPRWWLVPGPAATVLVFDGADPRAADPALGPAIVDRPTVGI